MIISKKNFEKEVERRLRQEHRITRIENDCYVQGKLLQKMRYRVRELEFRIRELEEEARHKGTIRGFYRAADGSCTILPDAIAKTAETAAEATGTQPEG